MNNLLTALNCVLPIFIKLSVGYASKRLGIVTEAVVPQLNKLCFTTHCCPSICFTASIPLILTAPSPLV